MRGSRPIRTRTSTRTNPETIKATCAPEEIRTPNLLIRSQMLYPLSYGRLRLASEAQARV